MTKQVAKPDSTADAGDFAYDLVNPDITRGDVRIFVLQAEGDLSRASVVAWRLTIEGFCDGHPHIRQTSTATW
jgi:hypothetical protein